MIAQIIILNLLLQILNGCGESPAMAITATDSTGSIDSGSTTFDNSITLTFTSNISINYSGSLDGRFATDAIDVTNGNISDFTEVSDTIYNATFTHINEGKCNVYIDINKFRSEGGTYNGESAEFTWTYIPKTDTDNENYNA